MSEVPVGIHPFNDGNGRMSRLLLLLLLYKAGYTAGKYVSIEKAIEKSKQGYYETLQESSAGWQDGANDYAPFVEYLLGITTAVYRDFDERALALENPALSKPQRVEAAASKMLGTFSKSDLLATLPNISGTTVERSLKDMLDAGTIEKIGAGRGTKYVYLRSH